ncbi:hypothetical protein [Nonomuraea recticatena]|uniref:Uncharacterized protein n=1 Tax=Nonomuraea recticatena TaxID=46178 RepID=A0ABP6FWM9_9ACTN
MNDWPTDLRLWSQTRGGAKRELMRNHDDAERLQARLDEAGLSDMIELYPTYIVPRRNAWAQGESRMDDGLLELLQIRRYL